MDEDPAEFGTYPKDVAWLGGQPITKSLLAKRHHGYAEIIIMITSRGQLIVYADNENDKPRFKIRTEEGIIRKGKWYHLVLVINNVTAKLYVNGILVGESKVSRKNMVLEKKGIKDEPLYIGADGTSAFKRWRYLKATIQLLRIYNKPLKPEQIMMFYIHMKRIAMIKHDKYVYAIYVKKEALNQNTNISAISKVKLIDVAMKPEGMCVLNIESNISSSLILSTVRFSKIVDISKESQSLVYPLFNRSNGVKESVYVCSYHIALDSSGNILWLHIANSMDSIELILYHATLLMLLTIPIAVKLSLKYRLEDKNVLHSQHCEI